MNLSFTTAPKTIFVVLLAVLLFCSYEVNTNPSGIALTGFIFACAALAVIACFTKIDVMFQVLRDELEPKWYAPQASAPIEPHPQRPHRYDLEQSLVYAMAPGLASRMTGKEIGECIRATVDAILRGGLPSGRPTCSCSFEGGCELCCPWRSTAKGRWDMSAIRAQDDKGSVAGSAGAQADQAAEAEIVAAGLTAPRVTGEQIQSMMASLSWRYEQPEGTTSTFAHAYLGRFYLVTGHSGCVSPENFDAVLGMKYAREQAEGKARDKLWELEGYKLWASKAGNLAQ